LKPNIFISPTLVVLKLEWLGIASDASCVYLPSLKTLNLKYVYIQTRNDYIDFLSACPILQDLDAQHIIYRELDGYNAPEERFKPLTLSKLVRASIDSRHAIFNVVKNVEFLSIKMEQEISSKVVPMFQNLIHTELVFWYGSFVCWDSVVELLQHSPKLQIIFIRKVCRILCVFFCFFFCFSHILIDVIFYHFHSGRRPAHLRNGNIQVRFLNVFRLT
jgi:hypothetical protein